MARLSLFQPFSGQSKVKINKAEQKNKDKLKRCDSEDETEIKIMLRKIYKLSKNDTVTVTTIEDKKVQRGEDAIVLPQFRANILSPNLTFITCA